MKYSSAIRNPQSAIILLGPTGSGKTPLGDLFVEKGFAGHKCVHFDFGFNLRRISRLKRAPRGMSVKDFDTVRNVLRSGALLAENEFHIAEYILRDFMRREKVTVDDIVVLNGLPRHVGQANALASIVRVRLVVNLQCTPAVVLSRIRTNAGGDRAGRIDDSPAMIRQKLRLFRDRTIPLLDHYKAKRVKVVNINVPEEDSVTSGILQYLERKVKIRW